MPDYFYRHPETEEIFEVNRSFSDQKKPFIAEDGTKCEFLPWYLHPDADQMGGKHPKGLVDKQCEPWQKDPAYVRKIKPKYIKTRSGKRVKYNPNTMR